jgi:hypothetical protein
MKAVLAMLTELITFQIIKQYILEKGVKKCFILLSKKKSCGP